MRLTSVERELSPTLNVPLLVVFADSAGSMNDFQLEELDRAAEFRFEHRRRDWLAGRKALKILLKSLNRPSNTMTLSFPDRQLSLSHGDGAAYAAGTTANVKGIGIDYEPLRAVNARVATWFLTVREIDWLKQQCPHDLDCQLIRLWTIKEAAFKSLASNEGMTLNEFSVIEPDELKINSVTVIDGTNIRVACRKSGRGYLSIAICQESS